MPLRVFFALDRRNLNSTVKKYIKLMLILFCPVLDSCGIRLVES